MSGRIEAMLARRSGAQRRSIPATSRPLTGVAVLSCMDARIDVYRILGLAEGEAHVIRNAGAIITEDVTVALAVSQRLLDTREILVMHHLDCAMGHVNDEDLIDAVERDTGQRPPWRFTTCLDPVSRVREAVRLLAVDPFLPHTELIRGVLYDERADALTQVCHALPAPRRRPANSMD